MKRYPTFGDLAVIVFACLFLQLVIGVLLSWSLMFAGATKEIAQAVVYPVCMGSAIIYAAYYRWSRERAPFELRPLFTLKVSWVPIILWGAVTMFATGIAMEPLIMLFPKSWLDSLHQAIGRGPWMILTTVVMAPLLEELLCRGLVQTSAIRKYGAWRGILIASLFFGIIHFNPVQLPVAFIMGIILGYVCYRTGSLIPAIILHAINNGIAAWQNEAGMGLQTTRTIVANDLAYFTIYGVSIVIMALGAILIYKSLSKKPGTAAGGAY